MPSRPSAVYYAEAIVSWSSTYSPNWRVRDQWPWMRAPSPEQPSEMRPSEARTSAQPPRSPPTSRRHIVRHPAGKTLACYRLWARIQVAHLRHSTGCWSPARDCWLNRERQQGGVIWFLNWNFSCVAWFVLKGNSLQLKKISFQVGTMGVYL